MGTAGSSRALSLHSFSAVTFVLLNNHRMEGLPSKAQVIKVLHQGFEVDCLCDTHCVNLSDLCTLEVDETRKKQSRWILFVAVSRRIEDLLQIMFVCCFDGKSLWEGQGFVRDRYTTISMHDGS